MVKRTGPSPKIPPFNPATLPPKQRAVYEAFVAQHGLDGLQRALAERERILRMGFRCWREDDAA